MYILREKQKEIEKLRKTGITNKEDRIKFEQELEQKKEKAEKSRIYLNNFKSKVKDEKNEVFL